jgi:hypothetical protein
LQKNFSPPRGRKSKELQQELQPGSTLLIAPAFELAQFRTHDTIGVHPIAPHKQAPINNN